MNPLTQIKNTQKISAQEVAKGVSDEGSWHARYRDSAYVFVGGLPFDLTEGDLLAVFAQYGEIVDVNLVRDRATGKSRGFAFLAYEDQRSTVLAVDNLNGARVSGRILKVDHVANYKRLAEIDEEEFQKQREANGVCHSFQRGECKRGITCKYSHDEQRNANTGGAGKYDSEWGPSRGRGRGGPQGNRGPRGPPARETVRVEKNSRDMLPPPPRVVPGKEEGEQGKRRWGDDEGEERGSTGARGSEGKLGSSPWESGGSLFSILSDPSIPVPNKKSIKKEAEEESRTTQSLEKRRRLDSLNESRDRHGEHSSSRRRGGEEREREEGRSRRHKESVHNDREADEPQRMRTEKDDERRPGESSRRSPDRTKGYDEGRLRDGEDGGGRGHNRHKERESENQRGITVKRDPINGAKHYRDEDFGAGGDKVIRMGESEDEKMYKGQRRQG